MARLLALAAALLAVARTTPAQAPVSPAPIDEPAAAPAAQPAPAPTATGADGASTAAAPPPAEAVATPPATAPAQPVPAAVPPPPSPAAQPAAAPAPATPSKRLPIYTWGSVGTTFAYDHTYGSLNLGVGVLWKAGLAPNVELSYAFGNDPTLWTLRPGVTWFLPLPLQPYVGGYFTHWFVGSNLPDQNGVGGRAGLSLGRVISLGVTYDHALSCSTNCDIWTPQISASLSM
jgi:hypothetical protein